MARAREEERDELNDATGQKTPPSRAASTVYFSLDDDGDVLAARPDRLYEVRHRTGFCGAPQMGDQLVEVLQKIDTVIPEQVIAVPKISYDSIPQHVVDRRRPQEAEQLVEVPTIVCFSSLQQNAEQIVAILGVRCRGGWRGLQGFTCRTEFTGV